MSLAAKSGRLCLPGAVIMAVMSPPVLVPAMQSK
jgi:hypothetical protein